MAVATRLV